MVFNNVQIAFQYSKCCYLGNGVDVVHVLRRRRRRRLHCYIERLCLWPSLHSRLGLEKEKKYLENCERAAALTTILCREEHSAAKTQLFL